MTRGSRWAVSSQLRSDVRVKQLTVTYHALQSVGQLVGLQHVFALLVLGAVHDLGAIIDRLLYERTDTELRVKTEGRYYFKEQKKAVAGSVSSPQLKLMAPMSSR